MRQLLQRGVRVRAIVRSRSKIAAELAVHPTLTLIEANLLALPDDELQRHLDGCDAVISCLGHNISFKGIFGRPRDLVSKATQRLCHAVQSSRPTAPIKFILMSSVSVNRPDHLDTRRGGAERAFLWLLRALLPPVIDNQRAADVLLHDIGAKDAFVEWSVVRPDALLEGDVSEYAIDEGLVDSLFSPGSTNMANVAHFMCELVTQPQTWAEWKLKLPVITNTLPRAN